MTGTPVIERVGVVGCGVMGSGIAEVSARSGLDTVVVVSAPGAVATGQARVARSLDQAVAKGRLGEPERDAAWARLTFTAELGDLADRQLVVEAVREVPETKCEVFAQLDKIVSDPAAILASTTSSIPVTRLARATTRPGRVIGAHFFSPVPMLPLVEVIASVLTDAGTVERTTGFVTATLGKKVIQAPDRAGFVVNVLLVPYLLAAVRMVESGHATAETIDAGMTLGCAHPVGPLRLADLIGLDVIHAVAEALYDEYKEPLYAPPPLLRRMVEGGLLGKKSGRGFHRHS
ncbi:3-hydroxybutyryl-CoA dehydrogenase [Catellatospora tritici]|uniref:3-hydroxybutyryl-CoA dehydrogenase n=1 Tax=Catellatospora tritici TaxID=2851566 RepID=UPI001C2D037D|nr:3-hydroxybutyryl-CoA dehydrogenase [Catellatospora tritici]MBV1855134.1 3-hydroxybutyryl-CoA dehydrogenase [Catellatospora tritici]